MATRERPADRGRRLAADDLRRLARDVRLHRIGAGLSLRAVAAATHVDHVQVWELEHGRRSGLALPDLAALGAAVGLEVRLRAYPAGDPIRDAGQQRLLERLRRQLHPGLRWATEVPLPIPGDLRAWDAVISGDGWRLAVEAETVLDDLQALERRLALKHRDGGVDHVLLLVAATRRNRAALGGAPSALAAWRPMTRRILAALRAGRDPRHSATALV
jgi:transcriptional regulator with XRE-family HTH domain